MRAPPPPNERQTQRAILAMAGSCFRDVFIFHVPNGAHLAGSKTARFKQMGALKGDGFKAGVPDLIACWSPGRIAFIEVKRPKLGRLTPEQADMHERLRALGFDVATVDNVDDAYRFLVRCGAPQSAMLLGVAA